MGAGAGACGCITTVSPQLKMGQHTQARCTGPYFPVSRAPPYCTRPCSPVLNGQCTDPPVRLRDFLLMYLPVLFQPVLSRTTGHMYSSVHLPTARPRTFCLLCSPVLHQPVLSRTIGYMCGSVHLPTARPRTFCLLCSPVLHQPVLSRTIRRMCGSVHCLIKP